MLIRKASEVKLFFVHSKLHPGAHFIDYNLSIHQNRKVRLNKSEFVDFIYGQSSEVSSELQEHDKLVSLFQSEVSDIQKSIIELENELLNKKKLLKSAAMHLSLKLPPTSISSPLDKSTPFKRVSPPHPWKTGSKIKYKNLTPEADTVKMQTLMSMRSSSPRRATMIECVDPAVAKKTPVKKDKLLSNKQGNPVRCSPKLFLGRNSSKAIEFDASRIVAMLYCSSRRQTLGANKGVKLYDTDQIYRSPSPDINKLNRNLFSKTA